MDGKSGKKKKIALYAALGFAVFVALIILVRLTIGLNFILGEEIIITLIPEQASLNLHYGEEGRAEIDLEVQTPTFCKASCDYTFRDKSKGTLIESETISISTGEHITRSYLLSPSRIGSGQDIYSVDASCKNIRTFLCPSGGKQTSRSSLILVNYDLSDEEKILKESSKEAMLLLLMKTAFLDVEVKKQNERIRLLVSEVKVDDLQEGKAMIDEGFSELVIRLESLRALWKSESYTLLAKQLNESLNQTVRELESNTTSLSQAIDQRVTLHNSYIGRLRSLAGSANSAQEAYALTVKEADLGTKGLIDEFAQGLNMTINDFLLLDFKNYAALENSTKSLELLGKKIQNNTGQLRQQARVEGSFMVAKEDDYFCILQYNESACRLNETLPSIYRSYKDEQNTSWEKTSSISGTCSALESLKKEAEMLRNGTKEDVLAQDTPLPDDDSFNESALNYTLLIEGRMADHYNQSLSNINDLAFSKIIKTLIGPIATEPSDESNETELIRTALLLSLNLSQESKNYRNTICPLPSRYPYIIRTENLTEVKEQDREAMESNIDITLSDNPPVCCIFGECNPCCAGEECSKEEQTYPIIFLHGHAFQKGSTPSYSLDAFNLIQYALEDEGYLNAGIVTPTSEQGSPGEWGLSGKPVTIKASYYLDAYREDKEYVIVPTKSESIDTYALRLKDIIEVVKERTGKERVNIVAHSMGGLVARRYIQIFGDSEVDKLIMIAVPNHGIAGKTGEYCPIFGEQKECTDMQSGSLFMNRLNDPSKKPSEVKMYTIAGVGCDPNKNEGDGIVSASSVHLEGAQHFNITGSCGGFLGEPLHTKILDITAYPETMGIVKDVLED